MMNNIDLNEILRHFNIKHSISKYGNGHINDTYLTQSKEYILQRINTNIFKNPYELMENIENVTEFIRKKIIKSGGNPDRETLTVIRTDEGQNCYKYDEENYFRMYKYITDTVTIENEKNNQIFSLIRRRSSGRRYSYIFRNEREIRKACKRYH